MDAKPVPFALPIAVVVCTHNPRPDYLQRTLVSLREQNLPNTQWDLLLVDNASPEPLLGHVDLTWHPRGRIVREEELGLAAARLRGIKETSSAWIVFVDDDNVLDPAYLESVLAIATGRPHIGVCGGTCYPIFEQPPQEHLAPYVGCLTLRTIEREKWVNLKGVWEATPYGAGMAIRRDLAISYAEKALANPLRKMLGRSGLSGFLSGEDVDMAWSVCDSGYGMLVTPALKLGHLIPVRRLNDDYICKIARGHQASSIILNHLNGLYPDQAKPGPRARFRHYLSGLKKRGMEKKLHQANLAGILDGFAILESVAKK